MANDIAEARELHSIGDVSRETGISVYALRIWEKRYKAPNAIKLPSGHRRYTSDEIERLRLVKLALDRGKRPSNVVAMNINKLREELECDDQSDNYHSDMLVTSLMDSLKAWDEAALTEAFTAEWRAQGPVGFISDCVIPLLRRVGSSWVRGEVSVGAEHYLSQVLEGFLSKKWRSLNIDNRGPTYLVAALPGEEHGFGLSMCATVLCAAGNRVVFLGTSTPVADILESARKCHAVGTCISVSRTYDRSLAEQRLTYLRGMTDHQHEIIVGGDGAPHQLDGIRNFSSFREFYTWLRLGKRAS